MKHRLTISLTLALAVLAAAGQARPGGQERLRAAQQTRTTDATQSAAARGSKPALTVTRRLNRARLSAAAIRAIRSSAPLRGVVAVQGNNVRPLKGSSLWQLSNGGYIVVGGSTVEPEVYASEVYTRGFGNGDLMVWACYCPGFDANKDDGCKFEGPASALSCKGGGSCTCKFEDFMITTDGAVIGFEGASGN